MKDSRTQAPNERLQLLQEHVALLGKMVTRTELNKAFEDVLKFVRDLKTSNSQEFSLIKSSISMLAAKLDKDIKDDLEATKQSSLDKINKALKDQENGMKFLYDKVAALENGEDGEDGVEGPQGIAGKDADPIDYQRIIDEVTAQIPKPKDGQNGVSRIGWGAHPLVIAKAGVIKEKVARHINFKGTAVTSVTRNPDGTVDVTLTAGGAGGATAVWEEVPTDSGNQLAFTLAHTPDSGTLRLYRGGTRQQAGVSKDYTLSGLTITLASVLQTNEILVADYSYT